MEKLNLFFGDTNDRTVGKEKSNNMKYKHNEKDCVMSLLVKYTF